MSDHSGGLANWRSFRIRVLMSEPVNHRGSVLHLNEQNKGANYLQKTQ